MLADQRMLEVSSTFVTQLKEESKAMVDAICAQVQKTLTSNVIELLYDCLVGGQADRRYRCKCLTAEPPPKQSAAQQHLMEIIGSMVDNDVQRMCELVVHRVQHLGSLQLQYCCEVFAPGLTDAHRFVVDRELKEIFDQLRLQQALKAQEVGVVGFGAVVDAMPYSPAAKSPLMPNKSSEFSTGADGGAHPLVNERSRTTSGRGLLSSPASMRHESSTIGRGSPTPSPSVVAPMHTNKSQNTVIPYREHVAALQQSLDREKQLHAKLDSMNRAIMDRAVKEKESVEQLQKKMLEAQDAATAEMLVQLSTFQGQLQVLTEKNEQLQHRLTRTCEVAYVMDELCGKLNCEVLALRAILHREAVASVVHHRTERALEDLKTTLCCRGQPLVVDGGWVYGSEPPTKEWMVELGVGGRMVPTPECLAQQHAVLAHVVDALALEAANKKLSHEIASLQAQLKKQQLEHAKVLHTMHVECMQRVATTDHAMYRLGDDNAKLRDVVAGMMTVQASTDAPRRGNKMPARSPSGTRGCGGSDSGRSTPRTTDGDAEEEDDVYLALCRCKADRNRALLRIALLEQQLSKHDADGPLRSREGSESTVPAPPQPAAFCGESMSARPHANDLADVAKAFAPQLRAALTTSRPQSAQRALKPHRPGSSNASPRLSLYSTTKQ